MPDQQSNESEVFFESLQSVLEKMAFMFADVVQENEFEDDEPVLLEATMEFKGETNGKTILAAQAELCASLAENMLGIDPDEVNDSSLEDALREVLNMTSGLYLTNRWGDDVVFDLTVPEVRKLDMTQWHEMERADNTLAIDVEGFQMVASVII